MSAINPVSDRDAVAAIIAVYISPGCLRAAPYDTALADAVLSCLASRGVSREATQAAKDDGWKTTQCLYETTQCLARAIEQRDAAIARAEKAESMWESYMDRAHKAEKERDEALARRDDAVRRAEIADASARHWQSQAEKDRELHQARAEVARLREALVAIAEHDYYTMAGMPVAESMQQTARKALAAQQDGSP
jgi:hypothetical protein